MQRGPKRRPPIYKLPVTVVMLHFCVNSRITICLQKWHFAMKAVKKWIVHEFSIYIKSGLTSCVSDHDPAEWIDDPLESHYRPLGWDTPRTRRLGLLLPLSTDGEKSSQREVTTASTTSWGKHCPRTVRLISWFVPWHSLTCFVMFPRKEMRAGSILHVNSMDIEWNKFSAICWQIH